MVKGEGSRGGKIVGHYNSGRPKYGSKVGVTRSGKCIYSISRNNINRFSNFDKNDHSDAIKAHEGMSNKFKKMVETRLKYMEKNSNGDYNKMFSELILPLKEKEQYHSKLADIHRVLYKKVKTGLKKGVMFFDLFKSRKAYPVGTIRGDYVKIKDAPKHLWVPKSDPRAKKFLTDKNKKSMSNEIDAFIKKYNASRDKDNKIDKDESAYIKDVVKEVFKKAKDNNFKDIHKDADEIFNKNIKESLEGEDLSKEEIENVKHNMGIYHNIVSDILKIDENAKVDFPEAENNIPERKPATSKDSIQKQKIPTWKKHKNTNYIQLRDKPKVGKPYELQIEKVTDKSYYINVTDGHSINPIGTKDNLEDAKNLYNDAKRLLDENKDISLDSFTKKISEKAVTDKPIIQKDSKGLDLSFEKAKNGSKKEKLDFIKGAWDWYNKKYFGEELKPAKIRLLKQTKNMRKSGHWSIKGRELAITPRVFNADIKEFKELMLHEMCHQAVTDINMLPNAHIYMGGHGEPWQEWMKKVGLNPDRYMSSERAETYLNKQEKQELEEKKQKAATRELLEIARKKDRMYNQEENKLVDVVFEGKWKTGIISYIKTGAPKATIIFPDKPDKMYRISRAHLYEASKQLDSKEKKALEKRSNELREKLKDYEDYKREKKLYRKYGIRSKKYGF